ncbi:MAG: TSUP family transporter [Chitinivibrionales bacterium]|nr:TSUP family transporter [Chitinivibrionales bacterium]
MYFISLSTLTRVEECLMVDIVVYIVSGGILGFLIGLTGVGGGVLAVPVLILIIKLKPIEAVGTAGLYAVLTKIYAGFKHYRQGTINFKASLHFLINSLPGVIIASLLVKWSKSILLPAGVARLQDAISYTIIVSILFALFTVLIDYSKLKISFFETTAGRIVQIAFVFLIGAIMGMTSIGGGILIIPSLLFFYKEKDMYVGSSIFIALISMTVMSGIYAFIGQSDGGHSGDVNFKVALLMAAGALGGTHFGVTLSKKIGGRKLQFVVFGVIILAVIMMILDRTMH